MDGHSTLAAAFDGDYATQWLSIAPAPFYEVVFAHNWRLTRYELSVYALFGDAYAVKAATWNLTCQTQLGIWTLLDEQRNVNLSVSDLSTQFLLASGENSPRCAAARLAFPPGSVALAELTLIGTWAPDDACFDVDSFIDEHGNTCEQYSEHGAWCAYFAATSPPVEPWRNATSSCCSAC